MITNSYKNKIIIKFLSILVIISLLVLINKPINIVNAAYSDMYHPLVLSGFNEDVVANSSIFGSTFASATQGMDYNENVFYTNKVSIANKKSQPGLPDDGIINSESTYGLSYKMNPYNENNVLLLDATTTTGTLTLTKNANTETKFEKLYFLTTGSRGNSKVDIKITFSDRSSTTYKDIEIQDWYDGENYAMRNIGRVQRWTGNDTGDPKNFNPRMYDTVLELNKEDQKKSITSLHFSSNTNLVNRRKVGIFAITGKTPDVEPDAPILSEVTDITQTSAVLNWRDAFAARKFEVDVATDPYFTSASILKEYNNVVVSGRSLKLENLKAETKYYFRVRSVNDAGKSNYSSIGEFITLRHMVTIVKQPESVEVYEENINESLSVTANTTSNKELMYTWYLCSDEQGMNVIKKESTGSIYKIPTDLLQGEYYAFCEIYNDDVDKVKTDIVKISVNVRYEINISWGNMMFEFGINKVWDPNTHTYVGDNNYSWKKEFLDGDNNKIAITNNSSRSLPFSIEYASKEGAFNKVYDKNTSVQGRFYENNEDAIRASEYLDNLSDKLTFGKNKIEQIIETNKWKTKQNNKFETYFAFSGTPDLIIDNNGIDTKSEYETVGTIHIKFDKNR